MNKHWFTCRVRYQKLDVEGKEVKMIESYLVDAFTYTEAEARIIQRMREQVSGAFEVVNITKSNLADVFFFHDAEMWFKVKISMIFLDEESGKEKQQSQYYLMESNDVMDAFKKTENIMQGTVSNYVIASISYTKIIEVYLAEELAVPEGVSESALQPSAEFQEE